MSFQVLMESEIIEKNHAFAAHFKKKGKTFKLTCSLSTPRGLKTQKKSITQEIQSSAN